MRPFALALALAALPLTPGLSQQPADRKHFAITTQQGGSVQISAENMAREVSVLHLKGNVEIRLARGDKQYWVLRADEADFNIDTGAVESRGNVSMNPQDGRM
jgi:lipopolysaccharide assembly outer membrane protein LptD (OstA)